MSAGESPHFDWSCGSGVAPAGVPLPPPGARFGTFDILGTLGQGGMGVVLAARDAMGRDVALKLLNQARPSEHALERFRREGQVMASLRHPGIVTVHEAGVVHGVPFLSCTQIEGRDLDAVLEAGAPREVLLGLVEEIAEAVGYAHQEGVVHRDLKPANVLVDTQGHAHVTDFGLAQAVGLERMTLTGALVGTPTYMAPEQIASAREAYGPHTDTWALGVLLYRALTGTEPFSSDRLVDLSAAILRSDPVAPRSLDATIPANLEAVCLKALSKAPADRYPDGRAFATDLARGRSGERPVAQGQRQRRARRTILAGVLGLAALALVGVAVVMSKNHDPPQAANASPASPFPTLSVDDTLLGRELDQALDRLFQTQRADRIDRLALRLRQSPRLHHRLREAQAKLSATLQAQLQPTDRPLEELLPTLLGLAAIRKALPKDAPLFPNAEAATNTIVRACARAIRAGRPPAVDTLEALQRCGVRCTDLRAASELFHAFGVNVGLEHDPDRTRRGRRLLLVCPKLDIGTGAYRGNQPQLLQRFRSTGTGPWATYSQARLALPKTEARQTLLRMLEKPPAGFDLGPLHWAETAYKVAPFETRAKELQLLLEAARRAPNHPIVQADLAAVLARSKRPEEAVAAIERSVASFVEHGFDKDANLQNEWEAILASRVKRLAEHNRRPRARAAYRALEQAFPPKTSGPSPVIQVRKRYPWLTE